MRLATLRRSRTEPPLPGLHGTARVAASGRRGSDVRALARRVRPGDVVVLDRLDLDAAAARHLVAAGAAAVVNASPSISGRFPALGAKVLVDNDVLLLDRVGPEVLRTVSDGDKVRLDGHLLHRGDEAVARGEPLGPAEVERLRERARAGLAVQLEAFAGNTAEQLRTQGELFLDGEGVPEPTLSVRDRPVVVVSRGPGWREDLTGLRAWMRETKPVLVGVDDGADALLAVGLTPDLLVGDLAMMSDKAQDCGAEHLPAFLPGATSEDSALLVAHARDAALVVTVGSRASVADFVDRARAHMAGSFLTRLTVGPRLVDASTVASVYRAPAATWPLWLLVLLLLAAAVAVTMLSGDASPVGQWRDDAVTWVRELTGLTGLTADRPAR